MMVSDASPLICLAKVGKLHLLKDLFGLVLIEEEVKRETIDRGKEEGAPDALIIEDALKEGWIKVEKIEDEKRFRGIHKGEGNTVLLATKHKCLVLIDEEDGREVARAMGLKVRGSLHVLKKAVENGLMSKEEAFKTLDEMIEYGFRISTRIYTKFFEEMNYGKITG
jgi:predicted nucleic acid-binding protein